MKHFTVGPSIATLQAVIDLRSTDTTFTFSPGDRRGTLSRSLARRGGNLTLRCIGVYRGNLRDRPRWRRANEVDARATKRKGIQLRFFLPDAK